MRRLAPILLILLAALVAAACGGGGGGGERLSRDEFVAKANEICKDFDDEIDAIEGPQSVAEYPEYIDKVRPKFEDALEELRELEPPEDLQDRYDEFLATGDTVLDRTQELKEAAQKRDQAKITRIGKQATAEDERSDKIASDLGLDECAND